MKRLLQQTFLLFITCAFSSCSAVKSVTWQINSTESIGGHDVTVQGDPKVVKGAVTFDGLDDGLLVHANPIVGAEEFTIEVEFKPHAAWPKNIEQRFLHIEDMAIGQRRLLLELRLNDRNQWFPDFFMRTEQASLTLIDSTKTYPVGEWATMTMVYQNKQLKGYVNGELVLSGTIDYLPIPASARTSLGTRMDQRSWFNGEIRSIKFWLEAVEPREK